MIGLRPERGVTVGRLRVGSSRNGPADPAAVVRQVQEADLLPKSLPRPAILMVRSVAAHLPRPTGAPSWGYGDRPWERDVVDQLDSMVRSAAYPFDGPVPPGARAVMFRDRAEVLAVMGADLVRGVLDRWWWRALFRSTPSREAIYRTWLEAPGYVPAAIEALGARGLAVPAVGELPAGVAEALTGAIGWAFGIPPASEDGTPVWSGRRGAPDPGERDGGGSPRRAGQEGGVGQVRLRGTRAPILADWLAVVPEAETAAVGPSQVTLLGFALALRRDPGVARCPEFLPAVRVWAARRGSHSAIGSAMPPPANALEIESQRDGAGARGAGTDPNQLGSFAALAGSDLDDLPDRRLERPDPPEPPAGVSSSASAPGERRSGERSARTGSVHPLARPPGGRSAQTSTRPFPGAASSQSGVTESLARGAQAGLRIQRRWDPSVPLSRAGGAGRISTGARAAEIVTGASAPTTGSGPGETGTDVAFQTALGGLFFLVNVGLRLGLYGDFTTPSEPGISLDLWDFVELLGRGLLDRRLLDRRSRSDPVWDLLAGLSRRRGGPPGAGFEPPVDWRTPAGWLAPFDPSGRWIWSARRGRLRVEHPEGFVVLDVRRENQGSRESIDRELSTAGIRDVPLAPGRVTSLPGQALLRWVAILAGYVRARISLALGVPPVEAADLLLRRPARILVTPTHVDVAMSLAAHPIEIRLAGLDIEPGWIPAAGRFLSFHFD